MATSNITIRMDTELKQQAEALFNELGFSMTTAFVAFAKQAVHEQGIPFQFSRKRFPQSLSEETRAALRETEDMLKHPEKYKSYTSAEEMMQDILR